MTVEDTQLQRGRRSRLSMLRSRRGRTRLLVVILVAAAAIGSGGWILAAMQGRTVEQTERADAAEVEAAVSAENARAIAEQIRAECERESETAEQLGDLCRQAEEVVEEPAAPAVVAPTDEQLRPLVREYTEDWLARNPPRDGRDGETPTADQLADLIAAEYARNPPQDGEDGEDGRTPTAAEIRPLVVEEVNAWLSASPPPPGEPGVDGQDGADGADGRDGVDGRDGDDGAPGEPMLSWTFTHCDVFGCTDYLCQRAPDYTPEQPTYSCEPVGG